MDYHMTDIIPLLPIPQPPYGKVSYNIPCPKCQSGSQHRKGRLNINLKKDVFRCPKCGQFEGGVFDLYAYYMGISRDDVRKELEKRFGRNGSSGSGKKSKRTHRQLPPPPDIPQAQLADIETRHRVYSALLNHLTLASDHKQNLLDRGLTEEAIFKFQYRTTPLVGHETIAKTLVLEGLELYGVPGFYRGENGRWTMHFPLRGIMIPCRDREGRIQSLHIRLDKKMKRGGKFLTFSTPGQLDGAAAETWCHVVGPVRESILLIEGYMKADIVHHFTGQTVIAIPGVTSIRHLKLVLDELIGLGVRHVMTCFDMDYLKNWHVDEANQNLTLMLGCLPITFGTYLWVPDYNGLDDYIWEFCLERRQPQS